MKLIKLRLWGVFAALLWSGVAQGAATKIRVACLDVYGTAERGVGPKNMARCLAPAPEFTFRTINSAEIRSNGLAQVDVLICPGGSGSKQSHNLDEQGRLAIQTFVRNGGGYVGICAGSYLASSHYAWSLALLNAKVVDTEHWARGMGEVTLKLTPDGRRLLGATNEIVSCHYAQGPLLAPDTKTNLPPYLTLAIFNSEMAKKGAPTGVMLGTTAIAAGAYGKGRVLCFSPHPEKTKGLEDFVRRAARWTAGRE